MKIGHYSCAGVGYGAIPNMPHTLAESEGAGGLVKKKRPASFAHVTSALKREGWGVRMKEKAEEGEGRPQQSVIAVGGEGQHA